MNTCATPGCGRHYMGPQPHCNRCQRRLNTEGLCRWCGNAPRADRSTYCRACLERVRHVKGPELDVLPPPRTPTYRDPGAKENQRETRRGTD